jgi:hypothetical protein
MNRADITILTIRAQLTEITTDALCGEIGKSFVEIRDELKKLKTRKTKFTSMLDYYSRELNKSLKNLPVPEGFNFPSNTHHGEKKRAHDQNKGCIRRALNNETQFTSLFLILVTDVKESSQTRKRARLTSKETIAQPITLTDISEAALNDAQRRAILCIANASSFRSDKCDKIISIVNGDELPEEDPEIVELSQGLSNSQVSNYSDEEMKEVKENPMAISKLDLKCAALRLTAENDIPTPTVFKVMTAVADLIEPTFKPISDRSMRRYVGCLDSLLTKQAEEIIKNSQHLALGIDSTSLAGQEYNSITLMTEENVCIIFDIMKLPDHRADTVLGRFSRRFADFSEECQLMLAKKVQVLNTDRAKAALKSCQLVNNFLNERFDRQRCIVPCSMHLHSMQEKQLRGSLSDDFKSCLFIVEKYLSKSKTHCGKKMKGSDFETFLEIKQQNGEQVIPQCMSMYSNVRFGVLCNNLQLLALNYTQAADFLQLRCQEAETANELRTNQKKFLIEIVSVVLVNELLSKPLWSQSRTASSVEFYSILEEQFLLSCDNVSTAASPVLAIANKHQNLMLGSYENGMKELFENRVRDIAQSNDVELNRMVKEKIQIVRKVCVDYKVSSDISILEGEITWSNQNCERSMGNLKRSYERRYNLSEEHLCLIASSMFNKPVTFWMEVNKDVLNASFERGAMKSLSEKRKRSRSIAAEDRLQREREQQDIESRKKLLFDRIVNFIPKSSSKVTFKVREYKSHTFVKTDVTSAINGLRANTNADIQEKEFKKLCIQKLQALFNVSQIKKIDEWEAKKGKKLPAFDVYLSVYYQ